MHKKTSKEKNNKLFIAKRWIIIFTGIFFAILLFLLLLPKNPDTIKGVTYNLTYPKINHYSQVPREIFDKDFRLMKEAGINTVRLYAIPPEFILDLAEKYNIKVIETVVFPGDWTDFTSPYQLQALKREAIRNMNRDIDRECIYAWSIWNDAPWTYGSGKGDAIKAYGKEVVSSFLKEIYEAVKKRDPLRPVTAATLTINDDAKRLGADFLDILGYNIYLGISDWRNGAYDEQLANKQVNELVEISREYEKPVLITETGYSTYWTGSGQDDVIRSQIATVDKKLYGIILFQWADDWSKSGEAGIQSDDVEEHWGILEGTRGEKGGYRAAKAMFEPGVFRRYLLAISSYFRGSYFASKKRALRKSWKEDIIVNKEVEDLQNKLNLMPSSEDFPIILEELAEKFFKRRGFSQFIHFLNEFKSSYTQSEYEGLIDYYIALSEWNKLEYLAGEGKWNFYYSEKTNHLGEILDRLEAASEKTAGKGAHLRVLYLQWLIHNGLLTGMENIALERLEKAVKDFSKSEGDVSYMIEYSGLLREQDERHVSGRLLRDYSASVGKVMNPEDAAILLKEKAEEEINKGNFSRAKVLYDSYINIIVKSHSDEDASFIILELANFYKRRSLLGESIDMYERLLRQFPNSELADDAAYGIALALQQKKSYSKAVKAFHDFIVKYPESDLTKNAIKGALSIFTVYGKDTGAKKTASFLNEIIALYPDSAFSVMARFEFASSLASLGRREEAVREYQYIIDNYPNTDYALYSKKAIEEDLR